MSRLARSPLARIRLRAGYATALEAARAVGCSRIYLLELEQGRGSPSAALLQRMSRSYGRATTELGRAIRRARLDLLQRQLDHLKRP